MMATTRVMLESLFDIFRFFLQMALFAAQTKSNSDLLPLESPSEPFWITYLKGTKNHTT